MVIRERPELWFLPALRLLESQRGAQRREVLDAFERSGQWTLMLYAHRDPHGASARQKKPTNPAQAGERPALAEAIALRTSASANQFARRTVKGFRRLI